MSLTILQGDWIEMLKTIPDFSVQCCVTSPPYWGLRDYGVAGQLGLEKTPEEYTAKMVEGFREVRRVLREDGTLWLNLGDSYSGSGKGGNPEGGKQATNTGIQTVGTLYGKTGESARQAAVTNVSRRLCAENGMQPKQLIGIPWRVAFALQADDWWLRQDIIWSKPNPMPESVTDRCTKAHEYIFLLTKSARYFYNCDAIREKSGGWNGSEFHDGKNLAVHPNVGKNRNGKGMRSSDLESFGLTRGTCNPSCQHPNGRNKRSVWSIPSSPYSEAHFATFPPDLIRPCILAGSRPADTVLDPFGGSGTTGMVALEYGRKAVLIELNPEYAKLIENRCNVTPGFQMK